MKADYVHKDSRTLEAEPQIFTRWIDSTIEELKRENQELKKQLEEINKFKFSYRKDETKIPPIIRRQKDVEIIKNLENQQKQFIKYLEDKIKKIENNHEHLVVDMFGSYDLNELDLNILKEILQKYKSIIGEANDKK